MAAKKHNIIVSLIFDAILRWNFRQNHERILLNCIVQLRWISREARRTIIMVFGCTEAITIHCGYFVNSKRIQDWIGIAQTYAVSGGEKWAGAGLWRLIGWLQNVFGLVLLFQTHFWGVLIVKKRLSGDYLVTKWGYESENGRKLFQTKIEPFSREKKVLKNFNKQFWTVSNYFEFKSNIFETFKNWIKLEINR